MGDMDASTARTLHMRRLVAEAGGPAEWVRRYGADRWAQAQVSQWISEASPKGIGGRLARDLEKAMGLAHGHLDLPPSESQVPTLDREKLSAAIEFVRDLEQSHGREFERGAASLVIAAVYDHLLREEKPNTVVMTVRFGKMLEEEDGRLRAAAGAR